MQRAKISRRAASRSAILSITDLIVLRMLRWARSGADGARRVWAVCLAGVRGGVALSLRSVEGTASPAVADGPKLTLFAEDPALRCTRTRRRIAGASRAKSSTLRHTCHLNVS